MSPLGDDHALEGCGGGLCVMEGRHRNPTHGRQGKRPAAGAAYVVGKIEDFASITDIPRWRSLRFSQRNQCTKRHRPAPDCDFKP
jgi:hypothetical protein